MRLTTHATAGPLPPGVIDPEMIWDIQFVEAMPFKLYTRVLLVGWLFLATAVMLTRPHASRAVGIALLGTAVLRGHLHG
jgi:hypothetical protein